MKTRETSIAANESMKKHRPDIKAKIRALLIEHNGLACFEIENITGMKHQTASAAMSTMAKNNEIHDSGKRRKTDSGRNAIVWCVNMKPDVDETGQSLLFGSDLRTAKKTFLD